LCGYTDLLPEVAGVVGADGNVAELVGDVGDDFSCFKES